jgi:hypothetical protein
VPPTPIESPTAAAPTPVNLQARLAAQNAALRSFQGQGRLEYEGPDGKARSSSMVVVKAPDKVRIDFRSPFSLTYTVVTDGAQLEAYDRGEKVLYRGRPTLLNLGRYTRVPVDPEILALLVRGLPPIPHGAGLGTVSEIRNGWVWRVPLPGGAQVSLLYDAAELKLRKATVKGSKGGDFSAYFGSYAPVDGVDAAHEIKAELPDGGRVQLTYGTIWRDRTHADNAFRVEPPAGVRVVNMDE